MAQFNDTWKLDMDRGFISVMDEANAALERLDQSFAEVDAEADRTNETLKKTEKEAAKAAAALEREAARAAKKLARELAKVEREAQKAEKALDRDVAKAARESARAMSKAEREAEQLAKKLDRTRKAAKKLNLENARKGIEGLAQGMQIGALSGERLANVWLAAGAAAGAVAFGAFTLAKNAIETYIRTNERAKEASDRLVKSWENMQVAAVEAQLGTQGLTEELDRNAVRLDKLTEFFFPAKTAMGDLVEEEEKFIQSGFTDSLQFKLSAVGLLVNGVSLAIDEFDELFEVEQKLAEEGTARLEAHFESIVDFVDQARESVDDFLGSLKATGGRVLDFFVDARKAERKRRRGVKRKKPEDFAILTESGEDFLAAQRATEAFSAQIEKLKLEETIVQPFNLVAATFEAIERSGASIQAEAERRATETLEAEGLGEGGPFERQKTFLEDVDVAFEDFAQGGIQLAIEAMGDFITAFAAGDLDVVEFGRGLLNGVGTLLQDLGQAVLVASLIGDFFKKGGLITSPGLGIALGVSAIALGAVLSGASAIGTGGSRGGGASGGDSAARQTARTLNQRRDDRDDRDERPVILVMDGEKFGEAVFARGAKAARRGGAVVPITRQLRTGA